MRRLTGVVTTAALASLAVIGFATPASAHNSLIASNPKDGASVTAAPAVIELTFDQPVQAGAGLNSVAVIGPGNDHWEAGPAVVRSNVVTAPVRPLGPAGGYKIGYRILSADGHPVSGELSFTLTAAGTGQPGPAQSATTPGAQGAPAQSDGGVPAWVWIAGAAVLLGAGLTIALRMGGKGLQ